MIYKLFLFGEKELFTYTEIFNDIHLKEGDMFYFEEKRYKILRIIRTYKRVEWDDKGVPKRACRTLLSSNLLSWKHLS